MTLRIFVLLSVLAVAMATLDDVTQLDYDAIPRDVFPGIGEYIHINIPQNWTQAVLGCKTIAANLLVIDSDAEATAMREMMDKYNVTFIHLGFSDQWVEGKYNDVYGNPISSACNAESQWAPENPKGGATYNCGGFGFDGFQDTSCADQTTFICEMDKPSNNCTTEEQPPGYSLIADHGYYKFHTNDTTWTLADQTCRDEGTHLVVLNSQKEIDALRSNFNLDYVFYFWVGVHRFYGGNDNFLTVAGEPLESTGYSRWFNDGEEPLGNFVTNPYVYYQANSDTLHGLVTFNSNKTVIFICEYDLF